MRLSVKEWLGKSVEVIMDRPIGSTHPKHPDLVYKINYGYIPGVIADDGEEVDAYILGENKPLERFQGKVIAIVNRLDDVEDKLVVASGDKEYSSKEIERIVHFQEQYWDSKVVM